MRLRSAAFVVMTMLFAAAGYAAVADLVITKTGPLSGTVQPSASFFYSISITSNGPDTVGPVTVTDTLPPGVTFVDAQTNIFGGSCSGTSTVTCTIPLLAPNAFAGVSIQVLAPSSPGPFTNTAGVTSAASDPDTTNNSSSVTLTVVAPNTTADLSVTKQGPAFPVPVSSTVVYDLTVRNNGPDSEPAPVLTDILPPGVTLISVNPIAGTVSCSGTSTLTCNFGPLASGGVEEAALIVKAPSSPGAFTNTATVTGARNDPNPNNNSSSSTLTAVAQTFVSDLVVTKTSSPAVVPPGSTVIYSISLTNLGPDTAIGVTVTDVLPAGTQLVSAQSNVFGGSCTGTTTLVCTVPALGANAFAAFGIQVTAPGGRGGAFTNTATVAWSNSDPNAANNSSSVTLTAAATNVPALSPAALLLLALALAFVALLVAKGPEI
jgi:uncharacterized repeat protein (TIGR01451 family)